MRLLHYADLQNKGIKFSRQHIDRLVKLKKFPPPFKIGLNTNTWTEPQIDEYVEECIAARDAGQNTAA